MAKTKQRPKRQGAPPSAGRIGRPSKFKPEFVEQARKLAEKFGATDDDAASFFEVTIRTITHWKHDYPEFAAALIVAKEVADARVEQSLYRRATGYTQDAVKIFLGPGGVPVIVPYVERIPPDPTSMIFWLKNRKRLEWRDTRPGDQADEDGVMKVKIVNDPDAAD